MARKGTRSLRLLAAGNVSFSPEKRAQLEALLTGVHLLVTHVISDEGPFTDARSYEEDGSPDAETRRNISDAAMYMRTANELVRMAYALTFGDEEARS